MGTDECLRLWRSDDVDVELCALLLEDGRHHVVEKRSEDLAVLLYFLLCFFVEQKLWVIAQDAGIASVQPHVVISRETGGAQSKKGRA